MVRQVPDTFTHSRILILAAISCQISGGIVSAPRLCCLILLNSIALLESQFTKYNWAQRLENTTFIVIMQDGVLAQQTEKGNMLRSSMRCW